jgi:hypothetical protein
MSKFSQQFRDLWSNGAKTLDIGGYDKCMTELQTAYNKRMMVQWVLAFVAFVAGLWAILDGTTFLAVLLLFLAGYFNVNSANASVMSEIMSAHRLLAMLVNKNAADLEALKNELKHGSDT